MLKRKKQRALVLEFNGGLEAIFVCVVLFLFLPETHLSHPTFCCDRRVFLFLFTTTLTSPVLVLIDVDISLLLFLRQVYAYLFSDCVLELNFFRVLLRGVGCTSESCSVGESSRARLVCCFTTLS